MNGVTRKQKKHLQMKFIFLHFSFFECFAICSFTSLNNGTPMPVKNPQNLYKTGIGRLQENESFKKLDGIEDAINDSLRT